MAKRNLPNVPVTVNPDAINPDYLAGPATLKDTKGRLACGCAVNDNMPPAVGGWHYFNGENKGPTIVAAVYVCAYHGFEQHGLTFPGSMRVTWYPEINRWEVGDSGWQISLHNVAAHLTDPRTGHLIKRGSYYPTANVYPETVNPPKGKRPSKASLETWDRYICWANDAANRILGPLTPKMIEHLVSYRKQLTERRIESTRQEALRIIALAEESLASDLAILGDLAQLIPVDNEMGQDVTAYNGEDATVKTSATRSTGAPKTLLTVEVDSTCARNSSHNSTD